MLDRPIPSLSQFHVAAGRPVDHASAHFRALDALELGSEDGDGLQPRLVGRPARIVHNDHAFLLFWLSAWAYPSMPRPRGDILRGAYEFPGIVAPSMDLRAALARGVPQKQARFAQEWGGAGPALFDTAASRFDDDLSAGPATIGEALFAGLVQQMLNEDAAGLAAIHDNWETDLLGVLAGDDPSAAGDPRLLAVLGGMIGLLRKTAAEMSEPYDHAERYWFAPTVDSPTIDARLAEIPRRLDQLTERVRTSLALATSVASSRTLALQQRADAQTARFQTAIAAVGSLVLGPTLVVGFFGANIPLPLGGTWWGFALMLVLMGLTAVLIWWRLRPLVP